MTRAKHSLHLIRPFRFFTRQQHRHGDRYVTAPHSRFLPEGIRDLFEQIHNRPVGPAANDSPAPNARVSLDVAAKLRALWNS
jgi:DNA helicase-2/ATP-dependent DNA helicase PcrA